MPCSTKLGRSSFRTICKLLLRSCQSNCLTAYCLCITLYHFVFCLFPLILHLIYFLVFLILTYNCCCLIISFLFPWSSQGGGGSSASSWGVPTCKLGSLHDKCQPGWDWSCRKPEQLFLSWKLWDYCLQSGFYHPHYPVCGLTTCCNK